MKKVGQKEGEKERRGEKEEKQREDEGRRRGEGWRRRIKGGAGEKKEELELLAWSVHHFSGSQHHQMGKNNKQGIVET